MKARAENLAGDASRNLLRSGFGPANAIGQVEQIANRHVEGGPGRTFGSVWRAMPTLAQSEPNLAAGKVQEVGRRERLQ